MKVAWIADFDLNDHPGGAQQTNDVMIKYGLSIGHTIDVIKPNVFATTDFSKYDLIILNNITLFDKNKILQLCKTYKVIRYDHDILAATLFPQIYKAVIKTIFLSPLHKDQAFAIGKTSGAFECVPSPIKDDIFCINTEVKREPNSVMWSGGLTPGKGLDEFEEYIKSNPDKKFYVAGWGDSQRFKKYENVTCLGQLTHKDLAEWYQKSEYFYHKPNWLDAFGRSVMEAYLCGCKLITNNNVGAMSYGWNLDDYEFIKGELHSEPKLWDIIEKVI